LGSGKITYNGNNEIGDLSRDFTAMAENLREVILQLKKTSEQVASSSEQLNASAEQSSQGAGQVAGTISVWPRERLNKSRLLDRLKVLLNRW
jgi:methyl-accepting chemotaxis protein